VEEVKHDADYEPDDQPPPSRPWKGGHESVPTGATNQTHGVVNLRGRFGSGTPSTRMPTDTMTNASNVPIWIVWVRSVGAPKLRGGS
jgi:hypothetical protein